MFTTRFISVIASCAFIKVYKIKNESVYFDNEESEVNDL